MKVTLQKNKQLISSSDSQCVTLLQVCAVVSTLLITAEESKV